MQPPSHSPDVRNFYYTDRVLVHPQIEVGAHTYGVPSVRWLQPEVRLCIGKFCSIATDVTLIMGGNHRHDWVSQYPFPNLPTFWPQGRGLQTPVSRGDLHIGHDVWIGNGATILSGITIGNGAVIGARAVVAKDVPAYGVAVGNPARTVKYRFTPTQIERLQRTAWWHLPDDTLQDLLPLLCGADIEAFLDALEKPRSVAALANAHVG